MGNTASNVDREWVENKLLGVVGKAVYETDIKHLRANLGEVKAISLAANKKANTHELVVDQISGWLKYFRAGFFGGVVAVVILLGSAYSIYGQMKMDVSNTSRSISTLNQDFTELRNELKADQFTKNDQSSDQLEAIKAQLDVLVDSAGEKSDHSGGGL